MGRDEQGEGQAQMAMPTNLKILHGETRPSRINQHEPTPSSKPVTCPSWLCPEAKREWQRLAPELIRLGVLTHLDRDSLAVYCDAVVRYREAAAVIQERGVMVVGAQGQTVKNPALQVARDQAMVIKAFGRELGLTPSSRSGIAVPEAEDDLLAELLSGGSKRT